MPSGTDPEEVGVKLTLIAPPARSLRPKSDGRPSLAMIAYSAVQVPTELESHVASNGSFRIQNVREGVYRLSASTGEQRLQFVEKEEGYPAILAGKLVVDFMPSGQSDEPLVLGTVRYELAR